MTAPLLLLDAPTDFGGLFLLGPVVPGAIHLSAVTGVLAVLLAFAGAAGVVVLARRKGDPVALLHHILELKVDRGVDRQAAVRKLRAVLILKLRAHIVDKVRRV